MSKVKNGTRNHRPWRDRAAEKFATASDAVALMEEIQIYLGTFDPFKGLAKKDPRRGVWREPNPARFIG